MSERTLRVGDLDLHCVERGTGPAVLLLMGIGVDANGWALQMPALAAAGFRAVAIDNRDVGRSTRVPVGTNYTPADLAQDALGVLDALDIHSAHVVGASLGGAAAQEVALRAPDRVRSLALVATWARSGSRWRELRRRWAEDLPHLDARQVARRRVVELFSETFLADEARVEALVESWLAAPAQEPDAYLRQLDCAGRHDAEDRLSGLSPSIPVRVIAAERDELVPRWLSRALADAIGQARLTVVPDAGHGLTLETPGALNRELIETVREAEESG